MRIKLERWRIAVSAFGLAGLVIAPMAYAQANGSAGVASLQAGYGGARYTTSQPATGSTRDANGNRLIVNGIIQSGASTYSNSQGGVASAAANGSASGSSTSIGGATAIGNNLNVVVQGNRNTVIVNSTQSNTGNISAGTVLNGSLVFP